MTQELLNWINLDSSVTKIEIVNLAGRLVIALLILIIGFKLINFILKGLDKVGNFNAVDDTLHSFLCSFLKIGLRIIVILITINELGVASSSIIALLGSAGLALGLSIQGSLKNIAGGVVLLFLKPFKVGDYILDTSSGREGTVLAINIMYTKLKSVDNSIVSIPNGKLADSTMVNLSQEKARQVQIFLGVEYEVDIKRIRQIVTQVLNQEEKCMTDRDYKIYVNEFKDSSIEIGIRFWVKTEDYWEVKWRVMETIKEQFDLNGIIIPYNKVDVTILNKG